MALVVSVVGCQSPIRALVGGNMNLAGNMGVDGDIQMNGEMVTVTRTDNTASPIQSVVIDGHADHTSGRIAIVDVDGLIVNRNFSGLNSMGENPVAVFREKMRRIECDGSISAVVLRINTPGGGVTATDILAHDVARLKQCRDIPIVACLMTTGCGGGYYLATHADQIVAHPTSVVGGIGVILNSYNMEDTLGQYNIVPVPVKSGDKIDLGSPQRTMEIPERAILQAMADQFHERFIEQVKRSRGARLPAQESPLTLGLSDQERDAENAGAVASFDPNEIFDGRVWTGMQAVEQGLVDSTGYLDDAIDIAGRMAGLAGNAPVVLLRRDNDRALSEFDVTPNSPMSSLLPISIPGLDRAKMPTFLYLWQPEPSFVTAAG
ncbi:S49 family peptidase [Allorhodopirellula solitaria]|uniref:S49 family peptidase n=1 Tax=Allorhodopirellula solitaria TaxID=2527987 RepID=UPI001FEC820E|nr:S49 family peptidase [Allorhodopirellula solitaria]